MSKSHFIVPTVPLSGAETVRLGGTSTKFTTADEGKFVKLAAESEYDLCAAGDPIEAVVLSVDTASGGGFSIGSIYDEDFLMVTADGLEATPGTGTLAIGDYVCTGTVVARNTALTTYPKVCKVTNQPFATVTTADNVVGNINAAIAKLTDAAQNALFAWRVVSLGTAGTGAVGTAIVVERVTG